MVRQSGLGRGLDALMAPDPETRRSATDTPPTSDDLIVELTELVRELKHALAREDVPSASAELQLARVADELRTLRTALDEPPAMALAVPSPPEHARLARELLTMVITLVEQLVALLLWPLRAVDRLLLSGAD